MTNNYAVTCHECLLNSRYLGHGPNKVQCETAVFPINCCMIYFSFHYDIIPYNETFSLMWLSYAVTNATEYCHVRCMKRIRLASFLHQWYSIDICIILAVVQLVHIQWILQMFNWLSDMLGQGINVYILSLLGYLYMLRWSLSRLNLRRNLGWSLSRLNLGWYLSRVHLRWHLSRMNLGRHLSWWNLGWRLAQLFWV